jgi:DNA-directed RNA polymerase subunit F
VDGSIAGVVVICPEAKAHITVIGTSRNIQLARDELGWVKLRRMDAPRILHLQKCDAKKARGLREELDVVLQETPRSLAVAIKARYERSEKAAE